MPLLARGLYTQNDSIFPRVLEDGYLSMPLPQPAISGEAFYPAFTTPCLGVADSFVSHVEAISHVPVSPFSRRLLFNTAQSLMNGGQLPVRAKGLDGSKFTHVPRSPRATEQTLVGQKREREPLEHSSHEETWAKANKVYGLIKIAPGYIFNASQVIESFYGNYKFLSFNFTKDKVSVLHCHAQRIHIRSRIDIPGDLEKLANCEKAFKEACETLIPETCKDEEDRQELQIFLHKLQQHMIEAHHQLKMRLGLESYKRGENTPISKYYINGSKKSELT
jgi:hypothetical protein